MDIKKLQDKVKNFTREHKLNSPLEFGVLDLTSEVGEVSKEILKMTNYGNSPLVKNKEIESELGDTLYSLIVIANKLDINLENALNLVLEKYNKRLKKGSAGSEVDKL